MKMYMQICTAVCPNKFWIGILLLSNWELWLRNWELLLRSLYFLLGNWESLLRYWELLLRYWESSLRIMAEKLRIITEILIIIAKKLRIIAENVLLELSLYISRLAKLRLQDCQGKVTHDCEERKGALSGILGCMWHGIPWYSSKESVPQATANHY